MISTTHQAESNAAAVYVAFELRSKEWWLTMGTSTHSKTIRRRVAVGDRAALDHVIAGARQAFGVPADVPMRSCYEAGRDGFWPHRLLTSMGVTNVVVDSSSIEVSRRARHIKTDRVDGARLLRLLMRHWGGERDMWAIVCVPSRAVEDARHANRARTMLQVERTRYRNRIHALLQLHGVRAHIDRHLPERLATATDWAGEALPTGVLTRLRQLCTLLAAVDGERYRARSAEARALRPGAGAPSVAQRLVRLRGVAARGATVLADELFTRALRNRREVGALTGLVSAPYQSGLRRIDQGLTRGGLPRVRHMAVQLAWTWLRHQPRSGLTRWYRERFASGGPVLRRIGIVALARRLMIALWRYVTYDVVPEGAALKAA
jgi:transposase